MAAEAETYVADEKEKEALTLPTNVPLCKAAGEGHLPEVKLMLSRGASPAEQDEHGNTALFHAAWGCHLSVMDLLLKQMKPLEVNLQNKDGNTALHFAVACGKTHKTVMEKLVEWGANIHLKNGDGETPQDMVRGTEAFNNIKSIQKLFELTGSKAIGASFLASMRMKKSATSTGAPLDLLARDMTRLAVGRAGITTRYFDYAGSRRDNEQFSDFCKIVEMMTRTEINEHTYRIFEIGAVHISPIFEFLGLKLSERELEEILQQLEIDGDGKVTLPDLWRAVCQPETPSYQPAYAFDLPFHAFDVDKDGLIGSEDFSKARHRMGKMFAAEGDKEIHHVLGTTQELIGGFREDGRVGIDAKMFQAIATGKGPGTPGRLVDTSASSHRTPVISPHAAARTIAKPPITIQVNGT